MCRFIYTQMNTYVCTFMCVLQTASTCYLAMDNMPSFSSPFYSLCSWRRYYPEQHEAALSPISRGHKPAQNQLWKIMQQNIAVKPLHGVFKQKGSIAQEGFWNYRQSGSPYQGQRQVQTCRAHVRRGSHTWSQHRTIVVYLTRAKGDTSLPRGTGT